MKINTNFVKFHRFTAIFIIFILFSLQILPSAFALTDPNPQATAAILIDNDSGYVLYDKNADEKRFPASTTKIMTALLTLENADDLDALVEVTEADFIGVASDASKAGFMVGEQVPVIDLLYGLMLPSGNEAANTLARYIGGSVNDFVDMMNERAKELGCTGTNFENPNGLHDENHYTTARDLAIITQQALKDETFALIVNTAQKTLSETNMTPMRDGKALKVYTTNMLIYSRYQPEYYTYAKGVKTGYTSAAGYCLVSTARYDGSQLISVVLGCERPEGAANANSFEETKKLFRWGFNNFETVDMVASGESITEVPVRLSTQQDTMVVVTKDKLSGIMPVDADMSRIERKIDVPESVNAPISEGQKIGTMTVTYNGVEYGTVDLVALNDISVSQVLYYADKIENFFQSNAFRIIVVFIILLFIMYFLFLVLRVRYTKSKRKKMMKSKQARYRDYDKDRHDR